MNRWLRQELVQQLTRHEGLRLKPYYDTVGVLTIGVGRNLSEKGITQAEALELLQNDLDVCEQELNANCPWWTDHPFEVQKAMMNMVFNLGLSRFLKFKNMLAALDDFDYETAAEEALDSLWADQVGDRAKEIAAMIRGPHGENVA